MATSNENIAGLSQKSKRLNMETKTEPEVDHSKPTDEARKRTPEKPLYRPPRPLDYEDDVGVAVTSGRSFVDDCYE